MSTDNRPPSYPLRLDIDLRAQLETLAKANGRSLNAEIAIRLEESLQATNGQMLDSNLEKEIRRIVQEELAKQGK